MGRVSDTEYANCCNAPVGLQDAAHMKLLQATLPCRLAAPLSDKYLKCVLKFDLTLRYVIRPQVHECRPLGF